MQQKADELQKLYQVAKTDTPYQAQYKALLQQKIFTKYYFTVIFMKNVKKAVILQYCKINKLFPQNIKNAMLKWIPGNRK